MKKVILFESSALTALQSVAQRNNNDADSDSLIFSLSPWIHNQGSHSSHCSHASRYSSIIGQPSLPTKPRLDDTIAFITEIDSTEVIELSKSQTAFACEHIAKDWKIPENELKNAQNYLRLCQKHYKREQQKLFSPSEMCIFY